MIDTHCHLYYDDFHADLDAVIQRARDAGVEKMITIAVDKPTAEQCLALATRFPGVVYAAIGVHPSEVDRVSEDDLLWIEAMVGDPAVVAVGEIGLDIYRGETNLENQIRLFERMLQLANHVGLPAIIHHRAAGSRTLDVVRAMHCSRGVFHCFSEEYAYACAVLDQGMNVSFTGNITYKNSRLPELAARLPLERLLLETDAPYMAPVPVRGKRCEPLHIRDVALKLAEIHGRPVAEVDLVTTRNAVRLFFADTLVAT
ncbi:TatD family hydrolase [candidate division KSB1 bacterium]|nr:TatD family hydrolase [candidate division KSB1 bacterium]